jgi:hypothetical protein
MRRDQLEHAIRTACQLTGLTEVIIVGSQAILGSFNEDELPFYATRSLEIDALNRPGMSGDSTSWEGWSHVRWFVEEVSAGAA